MAYRQQVGYQYETSPRKLKPEYEPQKNPYSKKKSTTLKDDGKQKNKKQNRQKKNYPNQQANLKKQEKRNLKPHVKTILYVLVGFSILFAISYRNSMITASFKEKETLKKELGVLQKENAQIEISIQNSLNLTKIQQSAMQMLGMQKIDESQKVYVNLPKKDYVEPATEAVVVTEQERWYEKLLNGIKDLIS